MKRSNLVKLLTAIAAICLMLTVFTACDLGLDKVNLSLRVKFVVDDEIVYKVTTTKGSTIDLPESPRKDEWVFDGWYLDDGTFEKPFDGKVSADGMVSVMVYAKWKACAHNVARVVAKAATCLEIGWNAYEYCSDCGYTTYEEIGALCHIIKQGAKQEANETNLIGWDAYEYCEREGCGYTTKQEHPWHEHKDEITLVEAQAPTCLDYGWNAYYSCSHEGCDFTATQLEIHKLEAIAHKNKEHHEKVDATCTETGTIEYWACPDCKKNYSDEACTKVVTDLTSKALDHDYDSKITTQPTCTEKGVRTYTCKRTGCGDSYTEDVAIDPNAHDMKPVAKKDATCTETGYAAYEKCSRCDHNTKGADLPALNHDYDSKITTQPTCKEKGVRTYTCKRTGCGDSYTEDVAIDPNAHDMKPVAKKDVTCTETGYAAYEKCSRCDHNTKGADIPALNHDYDSKITTQPTCTEKGVRTYTCKRTGCGDSYTEDIAIDPNAHDIENHVAKAATCTEDGWDAYDTCKREGCKYTTYKKVDALGHDNKGTIAHKDATCTETGVEGGTYCTRCDDGKTSAEKTIKALGHDNKGTIAHKDATCTETGIEGGTYCTRCNDGKAAAEASVDAIGHKNKVHHEKVDAKCSETGTIEYWSCPDCGKDYSDENCTKVVTDLTIKALGHVKGTNDTCTKCGCLLETISIATYASANGWSNQTQYKELTATASGVVVTVTENGEYHNSGKYYTNGTNWRFYQNENPSLTFTTNGCVLVSVKITYTTSNSGILTYGDKQIESKTTVAVIDNAITFGVGNTGTATNGQVRITEIEIAYTFTDEQKVDRAMSALTVANNSNDLPADGKLPVKSGDVTITWTSSNAAAIAVDSDGNYTVTKQDGIETVTLTVTFACGDVSKTKTYTVNVPAAVCSHTNATHVTAKPATCQSTGNIEYWYCEHCSKYFSDSSYSTEITESGTVLSLIAHDYGDDHLCNYCKTLKPGKYYCQVKQAGIDGEPVLYAIASMEKHYLATNKDVTKASIITVSIVDGGYTLKIGESKYLGIAKNNTYINVTLSDTESVWTWSWNDEKNIGFMIVNVDGNDYCLGTTGTFATLSPQKLSANNAYFCSLTAYCETHSFVKVDGESTVATCTVDGVTVEKCTLCDGKKYTEIPATGQHSYENGVCTECGDKETTGGETTSQTVTYNFVDGEDISGWTLWANGYNKRTVSVTDGTIEFSSAMKQSQTITDRPVMKGGTITLSLNKAVTSVTFKVKRWGSKKYNSIVIKTSSDGKTYSEVTTDTGSFTGNSSTLEEGTITATFAATSYIQLYVEGTNQIGYTSVTLIYGSASTEGGSSSTGGESGGESSTELIKVATFDLGTDGTSATSGNTTIKTGCVIEDGTYKLSVTAVSTAYSDCIDGKGEGCWRLGSSKNTGSFTCKITSNPSGSVKKIKIYAAKYSSDTTTNISINGKNYDLSKKSSAGEYDIIEIDFPTDGILTIASTAKNKRCVIDKIECYA